MHCIISYVQIEMQTLFVGSSFYYYYFILLRSIFNGCQNKFNKFIISQKQYGGVVSVGAKIMPPKYIECVVIVCFL